ncbi:MAG: cobalamin adenosyltransferase [Candidatus Hydrogenedentota bacterium]
MKSQVTTRRGDGGKTSTLGGDTVSKSHPIVECTGSVDELRAHIALVRQHVLAHKPEDYESIAGFLWWLLHVCFALGSQCSDPNNKHPEWRKVDLEQRHLERLEREQGRYEEAVKLPKQFIVSATNTLAAEVDVLTTMARRLERSIVRLQELEPDFDATLIVMFVNRLSDTLYMLARYLDRGRHQTVDYTVLGP